MTRLSHLNSRNLLIALHDVLATGAAFLAACYLRFDGGELFYDRLPLMLRILPYFLALSVVVSYICNLTTTKWRFTSLPDGLNILRAATLLSLALLVLDYILIGPSARGTYFFGKVTIVLYWFLQVSFLSALRFAYRYFRYTRVRRHAKDEAAAPVLLIGRAADAEVLLRGIESGAVKHIWPVGMLSPSAADRGQLIRNVPVLGGLDDLEDVILGLFTAQQADGARGDDAIGLRIGCSSGIGFNAAQARSASSSAVYRHWIAGMHRGSHRSRSRTFCCAPARRSTTRVSRRW